MDYRDTVFITVAENFSFSKAAGILNISQPAVTRHIKELEARYNTNLFERKGNKIYLTQAGEKVYSAFKQITDSIVNWSLRLINYIMISAENSKSEPAQRFRSMLFQRSLPLFINDIQTYN
ncbi:hypothetical protein SDC9_94304 [bioreactor metagenome]|uniref:HTH lysR-type domain-containing protein n=1 Tax=bioreactor metagenome TaxID=1076179 RepID=A0A645A9S6_9ZZZZ